MFKFFAVIVLVAIAGASAQEAQNEAAAEPFSYAYETDSHAAQEQRDPQGKVTGFYYLTDADGRQRRVDYTADESGFHAKVQTNEVGTKSANSADVEVLASPPSEGQLAYQPVVQKQQVVQSTVSQQAVAQPLQTTTTTTGYSSAYQQPQQLQQATYGYYAYPGYGYANNRVQGQYVYGVGNSQYGQYGQYAYPAAGNAQYKYTTTVQGQPSANYGYTYGSVGNYNNHLPASYYKSVSTSVQPSQYVVGTQNAGLGGVRYVTSNGANTLGGSQSSGSYRTVQSYTSSGPARSASSGSSNYIVLKKRDATN